MAQDSAAAACGLIYVFIHYTLLIAYIVEAGNILADVLHLSGSAGPLLFAALAGNMTMYVCLYLCSCVCMYVCR
jgi:hypothetical protein